MSCGRVVRVVGTSIQFRDRLWSSYWRRSDLGRGVSPRHGSRRGVLSIVVGVSQIGIAL